MIADDTFIYICADEAIQKLNEDLGRLLFDRLCQIKLKLNISKIKAMIISNTTVDRSSIDLYIHKWH